MSRLYSFKRVSKLESKHEYVVYQPSPGKHGFPANMVTVAPGMNPIQIPFQAIRFTTTLFNPRILSSLRL